MALPLESIFSHIDRPLSLPSSQTEATLRTYLGGFSLDGAPRSELTNYLDEDFRRFVHTLELVPDTRGRLLEIGANPYFTTILLKKFRKHEVHCTNYFGIDGGGGTQTCKHVDTGETFAFDFLNGNVDVEDIPFEGSFDVILFCEVIEHLVSDPLGALRRIKDKLTPGGALVLTTPNMNRLENVAKMLAGQNMYDPISGYGVYGRHNREYNKHELFLMLDHLGFDLEILFSSDVHANHSDLYFPVDRIAPLIATIPNRDYDLGQYIFLRARNNRPAKPGKPRWLYRSYPEADLVD
ncbi:MAG: Ubiquinone biosynthesis O-methyltransferase [Luteibacter sp.]|uniref:class I SAM-dependent methyltransferase n=1 Tax=Luteibacter sp. TaxID=1886636 RepID=UPI001381F802|nr:class I SAM-dependent methyltransferase [Luteibacter sp.]KAF1008004.1 MAG: Ubiquinone biosynthesis O-methyltransferase [Luteibacter sp.]